MNKRKVYIEKFMNRITKKASILSILIIIIILLFEGIFYNKNKGIIQQVTNIIGLETEILKVDGHKNEKIDELITLESIDSRSSEIEQLISSKYSNYKDNLSIFYYNLETEDEYTLNGDEYFYGASTLKLPQAMMILDEVYRGKVSLNDFLIYENDDYSDGTGSFQYSNITNITIKEAIYLSITESDNIAKNMLSKVLDNEIYEYIQGISWDYKLEEDNYVSARSLYLILKKLYMNEEKNPYYDYLIEIMKETVFNNRLDRYIEPSLVAHKIGSYNRYYHDIGIVYGDEPYILVVLTKDIGKLVEGDFEDEKDRHLLDWGKEAEEVIGDISKDIYDIVEEG